MLLLLFLKEFGILNGGRREQEECLFLTLENKVILHDFYFHFFFFLFFFFFGRHQNCSDGNAG